MKSEAVAETAVGGVVLAAAVGFLIYALSAGGFGGAGGGYPLSARFGQAGALAAGADVRLAGVKIGSVRSVSLDPKTYLAVVKFDMNKDVEVPADSTVKITTDSLLGGAHVSVEPGGAADNLKPGGEFENTQGAVDLFGLIGQVIRPRPAEGAAAPSGVAPSAAGPSAAAAPAPAAAAGVADLPDVP